MHRLHSIRLAATLAGGLLTCSIVTPAAAAPLCHAAPAGSTLPALQQAMAKGRFISYQPTSLRVIHGKLVQADEASIEQDLKVLRSRFDSLITYGSINGAEKVPDIAAKLGYRAVVMGIWDVGDATQLANVVDAARRHPKRVLGVSVGNETLFGKRQTAAGLARNIEKVRAAAPTLAISTTEPFHMFVPHDESQGDREAVRALLAQLDFLLPNVHPVFQSWFRDAPDANAADFVLNVTKELAAAYCGPILVKETGVPTAPADRGYTAERQASFYAALRTAFAPTATRAFAYFAAFDAPWRVDDVHPVPGHHPEEAWWGLFDEQRRPKPAASAIPVLAR